MKAAFLFLLYLPFAAFADNSITAEIFREESAELYSGNSVYLHGEYKNFRLGVAALNGEYTDGTPAENVSLTAGYTQALGPAYLEWDSEVSRNDDRNPYSSHTLAGYYSLPFVELGLAATYMDFPVDDVQMLMASLRHFTADRDFFGVALYADTKRSDLRSCALTWRQTWIERFETYASYSWGRTQEDIGLVQDFTSASLNISADWNEKTVGVEALRSWGEFTEDTTYGISVAWPF